MMSGIHAASCSFLRLGCRSDQHELFSASYARSNKKKNAKLLRCFPHCCPDHIERSYCGSSLHMLVTFESEDDAVAANENEDLVVCARFEAAADVALPGIGNIVTPLPLDSITALPSCALRIGGSSVESDWVLGEKATDIYQQQFPKNSILYLFNNHRSPQWYYAYDSGSTKAHRELRHVFAAYMFQLYPEHLKSGSGPGNLPPAPRLATVAVRHASPSFTIISYRRLNDTCRLKKKLDGQQTTASAVFYHANSRGKAVRVPLEPNPEWVIPSENTLEQNKDGNQDSRDIDGTNFMELQILSGNVGELEEKRSTSDVALLGRPAPRTTLHCLICCSPLSQPSHQLQHRSLLKTVVDLQLLLVMQIFMSSTPLDAFTFHFGRMDFRIQRQWLASLSTLAPVHQHGVAMVTKGRELVANLASKFSLARFVPNAVQPDIVVNDPVREQRVLQLCADLLLDAFSSSRIQQILSQVIVGQDIATGGTVSPSESCDHFCKLAAELIDELTKLVQAQAIRNGERNEDPITISSLVDEVLSLIYGGAKYQSLREKTSSFLLRRDESLEISVHALYRSFLAQQEQAQKRVHELNHSANRLERGSLDVNSPANSQVTAVSAVENIGRVNSRLSSGVWNCRWFLDPQSVSVLPLNGINTTENSTPFTMPSLLSVITLLRMFASLDITIESSRLTVISAMAGMLSTTTTGTEFELDGQPHTLDTLPNGLSSVAGATLLGDCWGVYQYQGWLSDDGSSIELLLFSLPVSFSSHTVRSVQHPVAWEARRVHVLLELDETRGRDEKGFFVVVELSSAPSPHPSADDIFDGISTWRWSPKMEVHATYVGPNASFVV